MQETLKTERNQSDSLNSTSIQTPLYVSRPKMASILGFDVDTFVKYIEPDLHEELHWRRFTPNGQKRFYVPQVIRDLKPARSELMGLAAINLNDVQH